MPRRRRRSGVILKSVKKAAQKRLAVHRASVAQAKVIAKKVEQSQKAVAKATKPVRAGDLIETGQWTWAGSGMDPDTMLQLTWTGSGYEYVPVAKRAQPKGRTTTLGELRRNGMPEGRFGDPDRTLPDSTPAVVRPNGAVIVDGYWSGEAAQKCGAKTKNNTPCQRIGNCPIPAHRSRKS